MAKAVWNGVTLAESDDIALVEGNAYFPMSAINREYFRKSADTKPTYCHWKGFATYFDVVADGVENKAACWEYEEPYPEAAIIGDRIAFWGEVEVTGAPEGSGLVEALPSVLGDKTGWEALCWLIRNSEKTELSADEVAEIAKIPPGELKDAWQAHDVLRYAARYKWRLADDPPRMEKTE